MEARRRQLLKWAIAAFPTAALSEAGRGYPSRPVHWIVPFAAGGGTDIVARLVGQWLSERRGQPFVIENRPGGGANIGTEAVVRSAPDGYTLLLVASVNAINASLYDKLAFDFLRDITPIVGLIRVPNVMVVHPSVPAMSIPEFIAFARAHPRTINMGSAGSGTTQHVAGELLNIMAGIDMVHVPYRGTAPALTDLLGGRVQVMFLSPASAAEYIRAGKVRALAVTSATRSPALPDVPAMAEFLPGFEASLVYGIGAPRGTPAEVIDQLNRDVNAALVDPGIKARLAMLDGAVIGGSSADFAALLAEETAKWRRVINRANIKPD